MTLLERPGELVVARPDTSASLSKHSIPTDRDFSAHHVVTEGSRHPDRITEVRSNGADAANLSSSAFGVSRPAPDRSFRGLDSAPPVGQSMEAAGSAPAGPVQADQKQRGPEENSVRVGEGNGMSAWHTFLTAVKTGWLVVQGFGDGLANRVIMREWDSFLPQLSVFDSKSDMERMRSLLSWDPHGAMGERAASTNDRMQYKGDPDIKKMQDAARAGDQILLEKLYAEWKKTHPTVATRLLMDWDPHGAIGGLRTATERERAANKDDPYIKAMQEADQRGDTTTRDRIYKRWAQAHPQSSTY